MEALFKNRTTMTKSIWIETVKVTTPWYYLIPLFIGLIVLVPMIIKEYNTIGGEFVLFFLILVGLWIPCYMSLKRLFGILRYKKQKKAYNGHEMMVDLTVFEDYITMKEVLPEQKSDSLFYSRNAVEANLPHDKISGAFQSSEILVLIYAKKNVLTFDKTKFTIGTSESFEEFLLAKGVKIKQKK